MLLSVALSVLGISSILTGAYLLWSVHKKEYWELKKENYKLRAEKAWNRKRPPE